MHACTFRSIELFMLACLMTLDSVGSYHRPIASIDPCLDLHERHLDSNSVSSKFLKSLLLIFSNNRSQGRKQVKRDRAKCYRENRTLPNALEAEKKAADRYRKKYERLLKKMTSAQRRMTGTPSPRSKTTHLLRHWRQSKEKNNVARTLNFHYSILSNFKQRYKVSNEHDKNATACFACCSQV